MLGRLQVILDALVFLLSGYWRAVVATLGPAYCIHHPGEATDEDQGAKSARQDESS